MHRLRHEACTRRLTTLAARRVCVCRVVCIFTPSLWTRRRRSLRLNRERLSTPDRGASSRTATWRPIALIGALGFSVVLSLVATPTVFLLLRCNATPESPTLT
jgi:hypothetical protein